MTRTVVLFVVAVVVFTTATVSFAHSGGTASLLSDEEQLDVNFTATEGADTFETVEQPPDRGQSRSGSSDDSNNRPDTTPDPPAVAGNHTVAPPKLPNNPITAPSVPGSVPALQTGVVPPSAASTAISTVQPPTEQAEPTLPVILAEASRPGV